MLTNNLPAIPEDQTASAIKVLLSFDSLFGVARKGRDAPMGDYRGLVAAAICTTSFSRGSSSGTLIFLKPFTLTLFPKAHRIGR